MKDLNGNRVAQTLRTQVVLEKLPGRWLLAAQQLQCFWNAEDGPLLNRIAQVFCRVTLKEKAQVLLVDAMLEYVTGLRIVALIDDDGAPGAAQKGSKARQSVPPPLRRQRAIVDRAHELRESRFITEFSPKHDAPVK
ncbi:hypothetical protein GCM10010987_71760 [Bradyrhizobium guangdongense]|uniref:Uncharacterized protein n=1 Tax=Bradyrhizobium guangdongense TaxID=1325090 RepID=A0AA87WFW4_9BRAD|nr:hypothetical protein GCM10010987_71760 [Bradyrhizobium guangdongense]